MPGNLVAQAFQPVQMRVERRRSINDPQFFKKNIKMISQKLILYQHRLESLCHQIKNNSYNYLK